MDVNYTYDGKFEGNVLTVGQTGCSKTTFIQNIAKNILFGDIKEIFWMSKIPLSTRREKCILESFSKNINFKYPQPVDEFDTNR